MPYIITLLITILLVIITLLSDNSITSKIINNTIHTMVRICTISYYNTKIINIINHTICINNRIINMNVNHNLMDDNTIGNVIIDTTSIGKHI